MDNNRGAVRARNLAGVDGSLGTRPCYMSESSRLRVNSSGEYYLYFVFVRSNHHEYQETTICRSQHGTLLQGSTL